MYLSRLTLNHSRAAVLWVANPYRVHQRLMMACDHDPRLLFRIEETERGVQILIQSVDPPDWPAAFENFPVLLIPPEYKSFSLDLQPGGRYRFRLLANPTVKKTVEKEGEEPHKTRLGLTQEADQLAWLRRKLATAGAATLDCLVIPRGLQHSHKSPQVDARQQTHLAVLFEGLLKVEDPARLRQAVAAGLGSAKAFGFGLLSLASA